MLSDILRDSGDLTKIPKGVCCFQISLGRGQADGFSGCRVAPAVLRHRSLSHGLVQPLPRREINSHKRE
jgi:hypothetical protein